MLLRLSKSPVVVEEGVVVSVGGSPDEDDMHNRNNHAATQHGSESVPLRTVNRMLAFLVPKKQKNKFFKGNLREGKIRGDQRSRNQEAAKITI